MIHSDDHNWGIERLTGGDPLSTFKESIIEPICIGCFKKPGEFSELRAMAEIEGYSSADEYVKDNEGTYNPENGHFLCDMCYINNGMPSSPTGWKAP